MSRPYPPQSGYDETPRSMHRLFLYVLMLVIAVAFGGFVWQIYSGPAAPLITPPPGAYKIEPSARAPTPDAGEQAATSEALDGDGVVAPAPEPSAPTNVVAPAGLAPPPAFSANGRFVAQLAALQSQAGVEPAWARLSSRAPGLFTQARLDVERADLGARGVYYRVRAGYFADRADATRFCERIRQMGQDCIVVAR